MALQGYYAVISIYGWIHWVAGGKTAGSGGKLPLSRLSWSLSWKLILVWILLWITIAMVLDRLTDSTIPVWDALTTAGGIVATWMLARKILEQWIFWIVIDTVSVALYLWQGLYVTSILFVLYIVMAVIGYRKWKKTGLAES
jgi:nicotinamide mononucleotide transporter